MESVLLPGDVLEDDGIGMVVDGDKAAIEEADEEETGVETNKSVEGVVEIEEEETGVDVVTIEDMVNEVVGVGIETEEDMVVSQTGEGVAGKEALDMVEETNKEVEGVRVDVATVEDTMVNEVVGEEEETEDIDKEETAIDKESGSPVLGQRRMQVS